MVPYRKALILSAGLTLTGVFGMVMAPAPPAVTCSMDRLAESGEVQEVHRHYVGTFQWAGSSTMQQAAFDVHELRETVRDGREVIEMTGRGTYTHSREANFSFEMNVDRSTGMLTMTESNPDVVEGFITEGRHQGRVTPDGKQIQAQWRDAYGGRGTLTLFASRTSAR